MKELNTFIKENIEYKDYTCYCSCKTGSNNPVILFSTPFVEEYIFKLSYDKLMTKTNEYKNMTIDNLEGADLITRKNNEIDIKRVNRYNKIKVNQKTLNNKDKLIGIVYIDKIYLFKISDIPEKKIIEVSSNPKDPKYEISIEDILEVNCFNKDLTSNLKTSYNNLVKAVNRCFKYNIKKISKGSDIKIYQKAADIVLKELTPVFQKEFNLTPRIEFV